MGVEPITPQGGQRITTQYVTPSHIGHLVLPLPLPFFLLLQPILRFSFLIANLSLRLRIVEQVSDALDVCVDLHIVDVS